MRLSSKCHQTITDVSSRHKGITDIHVHRARERTDFGQPFHNYSNEKFASCVHSLDASHST